MYGMNKSSSIPDQGRSDDFVSPPAGKASRAPTREDFAHEGKTYSEKNAPDPLFNLGTKFLNEVVNVEVT